NIERIEDSITVGIIVQISISVTINFKLLDLRWNRSIREKLTNSLMYAPGKGCLWIAVTPSFVDCSTGSAFSWVDFHHWHTTHPQDIRDKHSRRGLTRLTKDKVIHNICKGDISWSAIGCLTETRRLLKCQSTILRSLCPCEVHSSLSIVAKGNSLVTCDIGYYTPAERSCVIVFSTQPNSVDEGSNIGSALCSQGARHPQSNPTII